jgi:hypothetical protein
VIITFGTIELTSRQEILPPQTTGNFQYNTRVATETELHMNTVHISRKLFYTLVVHLISSSE